MGCLGRLFGAKETADAAGSVITSVSYGITSVATGIRSAITGELPPEKRAELESVGG